MKKYQQLKLFTLRNNFGGRNGDLYQMRIPVIIMVPTIQYEIQQLSLSLISEEQSIQHYCNQSSCFIRSWRIPKQLDYPVIYKVIIGTYHECEKLKNIILGYCKVKFVTIGVNKFYNQTFQLFFWLRVK